MWYIDGSDGNQLIPLFSSKRSIFAQMNRFRGNRKTNWLQLVQIIYVYIDEGFNSVVYTLWHKPP